MTVDELRELIDKERDELEAIATVRPSPIESFAKYEVLRQRLVGHERQLCLALKRETVIPLPGWSIRWTQSHSDVRLVARQWRTWLAFECLSDTGQRRAVLCEFKFAPAARLTGIDYENLQQHPLFHSGLEGLGVYTVEFSQWFATLWTGAERPRLVHYLFCFDSCLVECAADSVEIVQEAESVARVWQDVPSD